tara:strand:+ start:166 stop:576 length:411 start_codon:yes stop_codon:yes gene_type:complete
MARENNIEKMNTTKSENKKYRDKLFAAMQAGKITAPSDKLIEMVDKIPAIAKIKLPSFLSNGMGWDIRKARKLVDEIGLSRNTPLEFVIREDDFWTSVASYEKTVTPKTNKQEKLYNGWFLDEECDFLLPELRNEA